MDARRLAISSLLACDSKGSELQPKPLEVDDGNEWPSSLDALAQAAATQGHARPLIVAPLQAPSSLKPISTSDPLNEQPKQDPVPSPSSSTSWYSSAPTPQASNPYTVAADLSADMDVDSELLSLVDDAQQIGPHSTRPPIPLYSAPPVRAAAKRPRGGKAPTLLSTPPKKIAFKETKETTSLKAKPKPSPKPGRARGRSRGGARTGGIDTGRKSSTSSKKNSLLVQAQENRARSLHQIQPQAQAQTQTGIGKDEVTPAEDDRLYCFCKSRYEEDRIMIGCDRCDEWYHPQCIGLEEVDVDLVDVFFCASCRKQHPHLQTTRKILCSRPGCDRSSRRQASKYCSDECGITAMKMLIKGNNLDRAALWEAVKDERKLDGRSITALGSSLPPAESWTFRHQFEIEKHREKLDKIVQEREHLQSIINATELRGKLLSQALSRNQQANEKDDKNECGWDTRLMWGDLEWARGASDGTLWQGYTIALPEGATWWCPEDSTCERHAGWQKLQRQEIDKETQIQTLARDNLIQRERDIRMRMENVKNPEAYAHTIGDKPDRNSILEQLSLKATGSTANARHVASNATVNGLPKSTAKQKKK